MTSAPEVVSSPPWPGSAVAPRNEAPDRLWRADTVRLPNTVDDLNQSNRLNADALSVRRAEGTADVESGTPLTPSAATKRWTESRETPIRLSVRSFASSSDRRSLLRRPSWKEAL